MPIPKTRAQLLDQITSEFDKLNDELQNIDATSAELICVDNWRIKDLLAVRLWWTRSVLNWVDQGRKGKPSDIPAKGYRWSETPRLNNDIVSKARARQYNLLVRDLRRQYRRLLSTIDTLSDRELLQVGVYEWAGNYPVSRWLSINTARQYHTARRFVRQAKQHNATKPKTRR